MARSNANLSAFDQRVYQALSDRATKYYRENLKRSVYIPIATTPVLDQKEYKKPIYDKTQGFRSYDGYTATPDRAAVGKKNKIYDLKDVQVGLYFGPDEIMLEGQYLAQTKGQVMEELARQVDLSIWKGHFDEGYDVSGNPVGNRLVNGILDDATTVADLNGGDSVLDAQGDVYKALTKMVESIPFRYRDGRDLVLGMTSNFFSKANSSTFTFDGGATEWDTFKAKYIDSNIPGFHISNIIVSDEAFTASGDTGGLTDDRLLIFIPDSDIVERAFSRKISLMGSQESLIGGINQGWGARFAGCVHDVSGVLYSEQITWA